MILGRNPALWAGLVQAGLNLCMAAAVVIGGHDLTAAQVGLFAAGNAFGLAVIGIIANEADPTTAATFARTTAAPTLSIVTASPPSSGTPLAPTPAPSAGVPAGPTPDPTAADPAAADSGS